ncbi:MAG: hypothetical protein EON48_03330 [Acetobacteraceae bacterium]|nr:MAG: hypothetical protein EON48_03330 [Acetobacteraceae bacterium]
MTHLPEPVFTQSYGPGCLSRMARFVLNGVIGTFLCAGPVTAIIALGWLTRRQGHTARTRFGLVEEAPGWLAGPRDVNGRPSGRVARALGGLAANIRMGLIALTALLAWTLPFTLLWLGAWWAGWENSFNKGYEQAFVGPSVFLFGTLLAALIVPALPFILAHLASEDRLSAAFEMRRLRTLLAQAGWRVPALGLVTAFFSFPFFAARGLITTATDWAPWIEDLTPDEVAALKGQIALFLAAAAFGTAWIARALAARAYVKAAPGAAGLRPGLWDGSAAAEAARPARNRSRLLTLVWYGLAMAITLGASFLILAGQFLDHAWWRWIFHPGLTLPWVG